VATGIASPDSGSGPAPKKSAGKPAAVKADRGQLIDRQLRRTRGQVKAVEIAVGLLTLAVAMIAFFLAVVLVDHWVLHGGLRSAERFFLFGVLLLGAVYWTAVAIVPKVFGRVNPIYAAQTIERNKPSLKNSLINFLLFRQQRGTVHEVVYQALEQQAASDLSGAHVESAVDRTRLIHLGYVLVGCVVAFALYFILSPKDPFTTVGRVIFPWTDVPAPARVGIMDIKPGNSTAFRGQPVQVSAEIQGLASDEPVKLLYTTADRQAVDQIINLHVPEGYRHTGVMPEGKDGIQQDLEYRIEAGDAVSNAYRIHMIPAPAIVVESVDYKYPAYTGMDPVTVQHRGDLKAIEGTEVTLHAVANQPIKSAAIDFNCDDKLDEALKMDGQNASIRFTLSMNDIHTAPQYDSYQLRIVNTQGMQNPEPIRHRIEVVQDLPPEVTFLAPQQDEVTVPADGQVVLEVRAIDPDFALNDVRLQAKTDRGNLLDVALLPDAPHAGPLDGKYPFVPSKFGLKEGDVVRYWAVADDNKSPQANETATPQRRIRIIGAANPGRRQADPLAQNDASQDHSTNPQQSGDKRNDGRTQTSGGQSRNTKNSQSDQRSQNAQDEKQSPDVNDQQNNRNGDRGGDSQLDRSERQPNQPNEPVNGDKSSQDQKDNPAATDQSKQSVQQADSKSNPQNADGQKPEQEKNNSGDHPQDKTDRQSQAKDKQQDSKDQQQGGNQKQNKDSQQSSNANQQGGQKSHDGNQAGNSNGNDGQTSGSKQNNSQQNGSQQSSNNSSQGGQEQSQGKQNGKQSDGPSGAKNDDKPPGEQQIGPRSDDRSNESDKHSKADRQSQADKQPQAGDQSKPSGQQQGDGQSQTGDQSQQNGQSQSGGKSQQRGKAQSDGQQKDNSAAPADGSDDGQGLERILERRQQEESKSGEKQNDAGKQSDKNQSDGNQSKNGEQQNGQRQGDQSQSNQQDAQNGQQHGKQQNGDKAGEKSSKTSSDGDKQPGQTGEKSGEQSSQSGGESNKNGEAGKDQQNQNGEPKSPSDDASQAKNQEGMNSQPNKGDKGQSQHDQSQVTKDGEAQSKQAEQSTKDNSDSSQQSQRDSSENSHGNSASGQNSNEQGSSPTPQQNAKPDEKPADDSNKSSGSPQNGQSPSNSSRESKSQGQLDGDRSGGGSKGGGQKSNSPGMGSSGQNTAANEGDGKSQQPGQGEKSNQPGGDQTSEQKTGQAGKEKGQGSTSRSGNQSQSGSQSGNQADANSQASPEPQSNSNSSSSSNSKPSEHSQANPARQQRDQRDNQSQNNEPKSDSGNTSQDQSQSGGKSPPENSNYPQQPSQGAANGTGGTANGYSGKPAEGPGTKPDIANLNYAKKATNLALDYLKNAMKNGKEGDELLKELGWTRAEAADFIKRQEQRLRDAERPNPDDQSRRDAEDALRSLGLRPSRTDRSGGTISSDNQRGLSSGRHTSPPPEYMEQYKAYNQGINSGK